MYAKILNNAVSKYPYSWADFVADNNNTNYGPSPTDIVTMFPTTDIAKQGYQCVDVVDVPKPAIDLRSQSCTEGVPALVNGVWTQTWNVVALPDDQIASLKAAQANSINSQCQQLIYAIASDNTQKNMIANFAAGNMDATAQAAFKDSLVWIAAMQTAARSFIASGSVGTWPPAPSNVVALANTY